MPTTLVQTANSQKYNNLHLPVREGLDHCIKMLCCLVFNSITLHNYSIGLFRGHLPIYFSPFMLTTFCEVAQCSFGSSYLESKPRHRKVNCWRSRRLCTQAFWLLSSSRSAVHPNFTSVGIYSIICSQNNNILCPWFLFLVYIEGRNLFLKN